MGKVLSQKIKIDNKIVSVTELPIDKNYELIQTKMRFKLVNLNGWNRLSMFDKDSEFLLYTNLFGNVKYNLYWHKNGHVKLSPSGLVIVVAKTRDECMEMFLKFSTIF